QQAGQREDAGEAKCGHHKNDFCSPSSRSPSQSVTRQATREPKFFKSLPASFNGVQLRKNFDVTGVSKVIFCGMPSGPTPRNSARNLSGSFLAFEAFHKTSRRRAEMSLVCWWRNT